jgi:hypothetical protein
MHATIKKICQGCGVDVAQMKRIKDEAGGYFCRPCWSARSALGNEALVSAQSGLHADEAAHEVSAPTLAIQTNASKSLKGFLNARIDLEDYPTGRVFLRALRIAIVVGMFVFYVFWFSGTNDVTTQLTVLLILITSVAVTIDSARNQTPLKTERPYSPLDNGWLGWAAVCFALWIYGFPYYVYRRFLTSMKGKSPPVAQSTSPNIDSELRGLKKLLDEGIITDAEWAAKKKELLGI